MPIFGVVPTTALVRLDYGLEVLLHAYSKKSVPKNVIQCPSPQQMKDSSALLQRNRVHGKLLGGVFRVMGVVRMR